MEEAVTTTSIVQTPIPEIIITPLREQALSLLQFASERSIKTLEDTKSATEDLSLIARSKKVLEEKRKEYVTPLNSQVKTINDTFKLVSDPLSQADSITREKLLAYRAEQERIRKEQEDINREKEELARKEAALNNGEFTIDTTPVKVNAEQPKHVYTDMGMASGMKIKKWEIADFAAVPDDYKMIDSAKVTKLVKAGIGAIPGIRIYEEEKIRITTK